MLPALPRFLNLGRYLLRGETLNLIRDRLIRMVPIDGAGITTSEGPDGIVIDMVGGASSETALDFAASLTGSSCTVRSGKILHTLWTGHSPTNPANGGWTEEATTVSGGVLTLPDGDSVWLSVSITANDADSTGALSSSSTESVSPQSGGGGGGGSGGGGGGGGGNPGSAGATGAAGSGGVGGTGNAGGAGGTGGIESPAGDGSPGGTSGEGQDGVSPVPVTIFDYANATAHTRRWSVSGGSLSVATNKPSSDASSAKIRICTRSGSDIIQHQVGALCLTLPLVAYTYTP